jgi:hypothetical protein
MLLRALRTWLDVPHVGARLALFVALLRHDARARFGLLAAVLSAVVLGGAVTQDRQDR